MFFFGNFLALILLIDLDREMRINLQNVFEEQFGKVREFYKLGDFGKFEFGPYSFYVEEMKAAPYRLTKKLTFPFSIKIFCTDFVHI